MKKKVFRLTENDLQNIIKNTVNRILNEDFIPQVTNSFDYKNDILQGKIDKCRVNWNDDECMIEAYGVSGAFYNIYVSFSCNVDRGMQSTSYDVPDDPWETEVIIRNLEIIRWDNETNEEEKLPYEKDVNFERHLSNFIEVEPVDQYEYNDWLEDRN